MADYRRSNALAFATLRSERFPRSKGHDEELLPGIPNEITLNDISTKLPWRALCILPLVSRGWKQAIQSHRVYDARVCSHTTETFVVHSHSLDKYSHSRIAVYSLREKCCYQLPPIPQLDKGIPWRSQFILLEGKLYVLGGVDDDCIDGKREAYAMDLAGQRQWTQCASMQQGRRHFGCGVKGGKIYVFGGFNRFGPLYESEEYDPKVNAWFPIMPIPALGSQVAISGEELLVFGGGIRDLKDFTSGGLFLEVYHPGKDEWRAVYPFDKHHAGTVFMYAEKFYLITQHGIYVHDTDKNSWRDLHSNSFASIDSCRVEPYAIVVINDKLFAKASWYENGDPTYALQSRLLQSKGFRGVNKEIVWQETNCSYLCGDYMCLIEL